MPRVVQLPRLLRGFPPSARHTHRQLLQVYVIFGDFGLLNDLSMAPLIADATSGAFDSVLHVGDWA